MPLNTRQRIARKMYNLGITHGIEWIASRRDRPHLAEMMVRIADRAIHHQPTTARSFVAMGLRDAIAELGRVA